MVCSTCGYENQVGNRFCGMCGTPLPHRPLTTPGAQSTASLTRAPAVESRDETLGTPISTAVPPQPELVPEMPLDEYVQNFRYVPPTDSEEVTMRGETGVMTPELPPTRPADTPVAPEETPGVSTDATPPSADDVRERMGLEANSPAEERSERPRFLDISEPSAPPLPSTSAPPISGPAFLGASDVSQVQTPEELSAEEPTRGKWRIWLTVAAILVFGVLAVLEWQAQVRQTSNGPVEVIKMKIRTLSHNKQAQAAGSGSGSSAPSSGSTSQLEMQVEPPSKSQNQTSIGNGVTSGAVKNAEPVPNTSAATAPPASTPPGTPASVGRQPIPGQVTATAPQNPARTSPERNAMTDPTTAMPPSDKSKSIGSQQPGSVRSPAAGKASPSTRATGDNDQAVVKKSNPGAEEMAKANNASDSAAEAAWLWKATAKGNPDAPVRLADMYVKGDGVPRGCEQAMVLLKTAAIKENAPARNRLASMYNSGTCVQRDRVEAYRWLSSALVADPGSEWARQNRELLWQQMTPEERGAIQPPH